MAIHRFLHDYSIAPPEAERLADAFEQARRALDIADARGPMAEFVARKIIDAHRSGVGDPDALAQAVVETLRSRAPGKLVRPLEGCCVMIVEDEYFLADDLRTAFKTLGADVVGPISDLGQALARADDGGFDLAVIDVRLSDHDAFALADRLAARKIPFAFATGLDASTIPQRFAGVMFWSKPYDPLTLARDVLRLWPG